MFSRCSTLRGLQKISLSRINSDYVDHHETREGKHTTHMLPSEDNVVEAVLPVAERETRSNTQSRAGVFTHHHSLQRLRP